MTNQHWRPQVTPFADWMGPVHHCVLCPMLQPVIDDDQLEDLFRFATRGRDQSQVCDLTAPMRVAQCACHLTFLVVFGECRTVIKCTAADDKLSYTILSNSPVE